MKIVITPRGFANYGEKELDKLRSHGFQVSYNNTGQAYSPEKFLELSKDADGIIVGVDLIDQAFIDQCPQLKVILQIRCRNRQHRCCLRGIERNLCWTNHWL